VGMASTARPIHSRRPARVVVSVVAIVLTPVSRSARACRLLGRPFGREDNCAALALLSRHLGERAPSPVRSDRR
jgi:hypothetical protein